MVTDRATVAEKAAAWDELMKSTEDESDALANAWLNLVTRVLLREAGGGPGSRPCATTGGPTDGSAPFTGCVAASRPTGEPNSKET